MEVDAQTIASVDKAVEQITFAEYIEAQQKRIEGLEQVLADEGLEPYKQDPQIDKVPKEIREAINKLSRDLEADLVSIGNLFTDDQIDLKEYLEWRFKKLEKFVEVFNEKYSQIAGETINIERFRPSDWIFAGRNYDFDF